MSVTKTRPIPASVQEKLSKLLPRLASTFDGERISVVHAIERTLKAAGLDWHDLTGAVVAPAAAPPQPPPRSSRPHEGETLQSEELRNLVTTLRSRCQFSRSSEDFLDGMMRRADTYSDVYLSKKQWAWLCDLARQAGVA